METLFNKWESEGWHEYISLAGAVIGWTRGTGLMSGNNMVAAGIERHGCRTFDQREMSLAIVSLLAPAVVAASQEAPIWAWLTGAHENYLAPISLSFSVFCGGFDFKCPYFTSP